jgi:hypothetical protein
VIIITGFGGSLVKENGFCYLFSSMRGRRMSDPMISYKVADAFVAAVKRYRMS